MNIDLNLENVYNLKLESEDLTKFTFNSPVVGDDPIEITVLIQKANNPFLEEFLNLAFGPSKVDENGKIIIDDFAGIKHQDPSKALSTVLFCGLAYLSKNKDNYIGIDGSDFRRAYLYYRTMQRNYDYLSDYFQLFGVKYFVRVLRAKNRMEKMPVDPNELKSIPYNIENQPLTNHKSLYNYFLFYLK